MGESSLLLRMCKVFVLYLWDQCLKYYKLCKSSWEISFLQSFHSSPIDRVSGDLQQFCPCLWGLTLQSMTSSRRRLGDAPLLSHLHFCLKWLVDVTVGEACGLSIEQITSAVHPILAGWGTKKRTGNQIQVTYGSVDRYLLVPGSSPNNLAFFLSKSAFSLCCTVFLTFYIKL